jgi:hypothetical protein
LLSNKPIIALKNLLSLLSALILLASCGASKEEQLISDYEQNFNGTKIDLKLEVKSLEKVKDIPARDSLEYYNEMIGSNEFDEEAYNEALKFNKLYEEEWGESTKKVMLKRYAQIKAYTSAVEGRQKYTDKPDEILATQYKATYTIQNPLLNNAEQTLTKHYYFNPESTKILHEEKVNQN